MFKNVIFDWSGVVKDSFEAHVWSVGEMMKVFGGQPITSEELKNSWRQPYMDFWHMYFPDLEIEYQNKVYHETIARVDCPKTYAYSGIVELIKKLKNNGCLLAVVSSDSPKTLLPEMKEWGLENIFDEVIMDVHDKTDGVVKILEDNSHIKNETVFIGDSNHEIEVAKNTGIKSIAVTWGFTSEEKLKSVGPDYVAHNIKELENILLS
jgi:phosphoglycolate phosphatase-like HAD superfamily hydrolase